MTDRELLELAAKAAGMVIRPFSNGMPLYWDETGKIPQKWNPLTDDGDALRLAVKLRINVQWSVTVDDFSPSVEVYHADTVSSDCIEIKTSDDPYAATRRAIVRAAAEIGKAMP